VSGKVAIVTGIGAGLGRAIAVRMAEEGAIVVGIDVDEDGVEQTVSSITQAGKVAEGLVGDVTDEQTVQKLVDTALSRFSRVDILVNNVGGTRPGRIWDMSVSDWDFVIALNLRSMFLCTRAVVPNMKERKSGRIVCMSSGAREGTPWMAQSIGNSAYSTTKAGVHGFIRNVSLELADFGITVNAIAPGPIETEKTGPIFEKMKSMEYGPEKLTPLHRLGQPADIANAALFLASDEASYITGVTLNVTGGR
jgi:3-oxoacyl-[acyl-carrier protein] reductase